MSLTKEIVLFFIFDIVSGIFALIELPQIEDNNIIETDATIRDTTNDLFSILKLKDIEEKPKLQQYTLVHNFLSAVSLKDASNLREIAKLSRTDKKEISNETLNFMTAITEVLNDDEETRDSKDEDVLKHVETFLEKLKSFKSDYVGNLKVNDDDLKNLINDSIHPYNLTQDDNFSSNENDTFDDNEFWVPSARRIFKGKKANIRDYPFMASIMIFNNFQCAGSIISYDLIVTAASCLQLVWNNRFFRENPSFLSVRVGSTFSNGGGEVIPALEVYFYPSYDPKTLRNNIALLRLGRRLRFSRKVRKLKRIDFDRKASPMPLATNRITILGWGAKSVSNVLYDPILSQDKIDIYPVWDCQDIYSKIYVTNKHFCAGFISKGGGACNRDVGGPGLVAGVLMGIISFGSPVCGTPDAPTVFTKVGYYADWIEEILDLEVPYMKRHTTLKPSRGFKFPTSYKSKLTTFKIQPIGKKLKPIPLSASDTLRVLENEDMFKLFLKTMLNSAEAEEYEEFIEENTKVEENKTILQPKTTISYENKDFFTRKTKELEPIKPITNTTSKTVTTGMGNIAQKVVTEMGLVSDVEKQSNEKSSSISMEETETLAEKKSRLEKELENDIAQIIDNIDVKALLNGSNKGDLKKIGHVEKLEKIHDDNNTLTLLYLSDSEKKLLDDHNDDSDEEKGLEILPPSQPFTDLTMRSNNSSSLVTDFKNEILDLLTEALNEKVH